jgi:acyl-coenzyme A thioesterase PaaI-like protein
VTDISDPRYSVPSRLGVTARLVDDELVLDLVPQPEVLHHGVVRASVVAYVIDVVSGVSLDRDPDVWTLTTDLSLRMQPVRAPRRLSANNVVVRQGRRSATCTVEVTDEDGGTVASGAIGFARVPRREGDPPKPMVTPAEAVTLFARLPGLSRPLREEAGIEVVDPATGTVEAQVGPELRNPAGTLQGAMVALLAEAAAEDLITTRFGAPVVVTDLDLRYLDRVGTGPVRTQTRLLGEGPDAALEVRLIDLSADRLTTLAYARVRPVP